MKKPIAALLPILFLITSCGTDNSLPEGSLTSSKEETSSIEEFPSSVNSSETVEKKTASDLLKLLKKLAEGNYTFNTTYKGENYNVFYNKEYAYNESAKVGYALLPSYYEDLAVGDILYSFQKEENNTITLGNVVVSGYSNDVVTNLDDLNYLSVFDSPTFSAKNLKEVGVNTFQTDSYWALISFFGLFGYDTSYVDTYLDSITLQYLANEELSITLNIKEEYKDSFAEEETVSTIKNIGTTSLDFVEAYKKSFDVKKLNPLTASQASLLSRTSGRVTSKIYKVAETLEETGHSYIVDFNEQFYNLQEDGSSVLYRKALEEDEENGLQAGDAYTLSLNPKNEVVYGTMHYSFDSLFNSGRDILPEILAGSFKNEDGTYKYHGPNGATYLNYLTGAQLDDILSMYFYLNDGQISKIVTLYEEKDYGEEGYVDVTYQMETTFSDYVAPNSEVKKAVADSNTPAIKSAFDSLNGGTSFKMVIFDDEYAAKTTYVFDDLVINDDSYMGSITGSKKNQDGSISTFAVTKTEENEYVAKATQAPSTSITLQDAYQAITAAPEVFDLSSDKKTITAKNAVGGFAGYIPGLNVAQMLDGSLKMTLENGRISTLSFNYASFGNKATEKIDFTYGIGKEAVDNKLLSAINEMSAYVPPTSWKEANADVYQYLVNVLDAHADEVPFFDIEGVDESKLASTATDSWSTVEIFSDSTHTAFVDGYKEALKKDTSFALSSSGYDENKQDNYEIYKSSTIQIKIYSQDYLGIFISLIA